MRIFKKCMRLSFSTSRPHSLTLRRLSHSPQLDGDFLDAENFSFLHREVFLHKQKKKKKHARTIFKFSPFTNTSTAPRSGAERVSEKLVFVIAIVLHFGVCNFSQTVRRSACSCGKSVLSREKTLHRNARKGNGEVYDAATSSVINKKCLNSYVNHFGWTIVVSTFAKGLLHRCCNF